MKKIIYATLVLGVLSFTACKKDLDIAPRLKNAGTITDINADPNQTPADARDVTLNVIGINHSTSMMLQTLTVKDASGQVQYYSKEMRQGETFSTILKIPAKILVVKVTYGTVTKDVSITNNTINFNLLPELPM